MEDPGPATLVQEIESVSRQKETNNLFGGLADSAWGSASGCFEKE